LFKLNTILFDPTDAIPNEFCDMAVNEGILTKSGIKYFFRHERIHRFFVASYLWRQDKRSIEEWYKESESGLGKKYWLDTLEFLGEIYAEKVSNKEILSGEYYNFLRNVLDFDVQIYADRLHPQLYRLFNSKILTTNAEFIELSENRLAKATASI
jgi:hypothetical protein